MNKLDKIGMVLAAYVVCQEKSLGGYRCGKDAKYKVTYTKETGAPGKVTNVCGRHVKLYMDAHDSKKFIIEEL